MYSHKTGIILRKSERTDLNAFLELKNESWWGTHRTLISNTEDQEKWFDNLASTSLFMSVFKEQELLGICSYTNINWVDHVCHGSGSTFKRASKEGIAKDAWSCGIDFAFEILNMHRVEAECLSCNYPAQKLNIQHIGMKIEGCKRQAIYKSGKYYDSLVLGILRSEWEKSDRVLQYNGSCNAMFDHDIAENLVSRSLKYIQKDALCDV